MKKIITRRKFLKNSSTATIAGALYLNSPLKFYSQQNTKSRVVLIRNKDLLDKLYKPDAKIVQSMLDFEINFIVFFFEFLRIV